VYGVRRSIRHRHSGQSKFQKIFKLKKLFGFINHLRLGSHDNMWRFGKLLYRTVNTQADFQCLINYLTYLNVSLRSHRKNCIGRGLSNCHPDYRSQNFSSFLTLKNLP